MWFTNISLISLSLWFDEIVTFEKIKIKINKNSSLLAHSKDEERMENVQQKVGQMQKKRKKTMDDWSFSWINGKCVAHWVQPYFCLANVLKLNLKHLLMLVGHHLNTKCPKHNNNIVIYQRRISWGCHSFHFQCACSGIKPIIAIIITIKWNGQKKDEWIFGCLHSHSSKIYI